MGWFKKDFLKTGASSATQFALCLTFFTPPAGLLAWSLCRSPPITSQPTLSSPCRQNHFPATETQMLSIWLNVQGYISKYIKVCFAPPSVEAWQTVFVVCTVQVQAALTLPFFSFISLLPCQKLYFLANIWEPWHSISVDKHTNGWIFMHSMKICVWFLYW